MPEEGGLCGAQKADFAGPPGNLRNKWWIERNLYKQTDVIIPEEPLSLAQVRGGWHLKVLRDSQH